MGISRRRVCSARALAQADAGKDASHGANEGKRVAVSIAEEHETLSPQQAAGRLGFSRQHVVRLVNAGELRAQKLPGSNYWQIPLASVLDFEEQREQARELADTCSRDLDQLGAPLD